MAYTPYTTRMDRSLPTVLWYAIRVQIKLLALIRIKFHSEHTLSRIKKEKSKHVRKNNTSVHCSWRYDKSRSIRLYNGQAREDARKILLNSRRSKERKREREKKREGGGAKDIRRQVALYRGCGKWIIADVKKKKHPLPSSSDRRDTRPKERLETRGISPRFAPRYWPRFISRKDPPITHDRGGAREFSPFIFPASLEPKVNPIPVKLNQSSIVSNERTSARKRNESDCDCWLLATAIHEETPLSPEIAGEEIGGDRIGGETRE